MKYKVTLIEPTRKGAWGAPPEVRLRIEDEYFNACMTDGMSHILAEQLKADLENIPGEVRGRVDLEATWAE